MRATLLFFALAVGLGGCFKVDSPVCAYSCGDNGECPDNYVCNASDGYCHRKDYTGECPYSEGPDQGVTDLASTD